MTTAISGPDAGQLVERLAMLLDEARIRREILDPIDRVLERWQALPSVSFSRRAFHSAMAGFVCDLYANGLSAVQNLTEAQALGEAIAILEAGYQGVEVHGYSAAYFDASRSDVNGIMLVIARIGEIVKATQRLKHIRRIFDTEVDPLDSATKQALAARVLGAIGPHLPPSIVSFAPRRMTDSWEYLFGLYIEGRFQSGSGEPNVARCQLVSCRRPDELSASHGFAWPGGSVPGADLAPGAAPISPVAALPNRPKIIPHRS